MTEQTSTAASRSSYGSRAGTGQQYRR